MAKVTEPDFRVVCSLLMAISIKKVLYLILGTFLLGCSSIKHVSGPGSLLLTSARLLADSIISAPEDNRPSINSTNLANIPTPDEWKQRVDLCQQGDSLIVSAVFRSATPDSVSAHVAGDTLYLDFDCSVSDTAWHHTRISVNHLTFPKSGYLPIRFCGKYVLPIMPSADTISYPLLDTIWGEGANRRLIGEWQVWQFHSKWDERRHWYKEPYLTNRVHTINADGTWFVVEKRKIVGCGIFNQYKQQHLYWLAPYKGEKYMFREDDVYSDPSFRPEEYFDIFDYMTTSTGKEFFNRVEIFCFNRSDSRKYFFKADDNNIYFTGYIDVMFNIVKEFKRIK